MATHRRLKSPPIVEAVIDFRIRLKESIDASAFVNVSAEFKSNFQKVGLVKQHAFNLSVDAGAASGVSSETIQGARFDTDAADKAAIFTSEGFTFSHLKSYTDWAALKADTQAAWAEYSKLAHPLEIVRVGLRYINRIDLPAIVEFNEFFTSAPSLPPELPQVIGPFLSRVLFPLPDGLGLGSLTHVYSESAASEATVILDIDIFQENINYDANNSDIWNVLDKLRDQKNNVFFASVTEKTLEKYL